LVRREAWSAAASCCARSSHGEGEKCAFPAYAFPGDRHDQAVGSGRRKARVRAAFVSRPVLLVAFAFAVMSDPVSSVAYAMEAGLRSLGGDLRLLLPTMLAVLMIVVLVAVNYHYLYARFPGGGGDAAAAAAAFPTDWRSSRSPP
jgi:hypothetical protein